VHSGESLRSDRDVVSTAIAQDARALCWADETSKRDREIVLGAIAQDGKALDHAQA